MAVRWFGRSGLLAVAASLAATGATPQDMRSVPQPMMGGMMAEDAPVIPPVVGYAEGEQIFFLHTETSDPEIASILTDMMGSPVLVVSSLAAAPEAMLGRVYVFTNGIRPDGPRGPFEFQPDVFDAPPGAPGYSPLRAVMLVSWKAEGEARRLTSAAQVEEAIRRGELASEEPGVVVNMPFVTWPGGQR